MRRAVVLAAASIGCATADADPAIFFDAGSDARADGEALDVRDDTIADDVNPDVIFPPEDVPADTKKGTCGTPAGTTITASGTYAENAPTLAIDGDVATYWNSGDYTGWVHVVFPKPIHFDRVRLAATALPACEESYTFIGYKGGAPTTIGTATRSVPTGKTDWLATVAVTGDTWDSLRIEVAKAPSWITLAEIVVFDSTAGCGIP